MIVTALTDLARQTALTPAMRTGLVFLQQLSAADLEDGAKDIAQGRVHVLVRSYVGKADAPLAFEGHRHVVELQYVVSGAMVLGWAPLGFVSLTRAYNPDQDSWVGTVPEQEITRVLLRAGHVAVLYPEDAHALGATPGAATIKKVTLKVEI